jgi:hypothetical protein
MPTEVMIVKGYMKLAQVKPSRGAVSAAPTTRAAMQKPRSTPPRTGWSAPALAQLAIIRALSVAIVAIRALLATKLGSWPSASAKTTAICASPPIQ